MTDTIFMTTSNSVVKIMLKAQFLTVLMVSVELSLDILIH